MRLTFYLTCVLLVLVLMPTKPATNAQTPSHVLPNDVIFMSREKLSYDEEITGEFRTGLNRLNANTLEIETFFVDETAYILPLEWSPNAELFAILRFDQPSNFDAPPQLCFLTRNGELLSCTVDRPPRAPGVASDGLYGITWSEDSRHIYFLNDSYTSPTQGTRRIIEVDVATGETERIVFEIPFENEAPIISWKSDLSEVVVGAGNYQQYQGPQKIINLETGAEIDPNTLVPEGMRLYEICPEFSPFDTYMAVLAVKEADDPLTEPYEYALYVLDANETGVFSMDNESGYDRIEWVGCPVWQVDEKSIFFVAQTEHAKRLPVGFALPRIFVFDFETTELKVFFEHDLMVTGFELPFYPSPEGGYLIFNSQYFIQQDTLEQRIWQFVVVFPDGDFLEFRSPRGVDWWYPIWVPQAYAESS